MEETKRCKDCMIHGDEINPDWAASDEKWYYCPIESNYLGLVEAQDEACSSYEE